MHYDNTPTVVVILATDAQGRLITVRRNNEPGRGLLGLPGGYHMRGESWREAGAREFLEETGLRVDPESFIQFLHVETDGYGNNLVVAYTESPAEETGAVPDPEEVQEVVFLQEVPQPEEVAFPRHYEAIRAYLPWRKTRNG